MNTLCDCRVTDHPEPDPDVVADKALSIADRLSDPEMFGELANLCRNHPSKAAQVIMCLAAWFDHAPAEILLERELAAAHPDVDWFAVDLVVRERVKMQLNAAERREVAKRLHGAVPASEIGRLLGMSRDAVQQLQSRHRGLEVVAS